MQAPLTELRPPSPAQVVPQMNRATSPLELFQKFNPLGDEQTNGILTWPVNSRNFNLGICLRH